MALPGSVVWEVRTDGSDANGGGFVAGASGTDYSQQAAPQKSGADLVIHASNNTKVQPVAAGVAASDVGNLVKIAAGGGFTGGSVPYQIVSQDGTYWTLDRAAGTVGSTGGTYAMGGAFGSPGMLVAVISANGQQAHVGGGTYTLTTATPGSGGPLYFTASSIAFAIYGYNTTRGDGGQPTIHAGNVTNTYLAGHNHANGYAYQYVFENLILDGNNKAGISGINGDQWQCVTMRNLLVQNCPGNGVFNGVAFSTKAVNCGVGFSGAGSARCEGCWADQCTTGFGGGYFGMRACLATNCTTGFSYYNLNSSGCVAYACGTGFYSLRGGAFLDCLAVNSTGYGFRSDAYATVAGCYGYNNTSGNQTGTFWGSIKALSGDPFVDAANGDFRLNDTAGAGAVLRRSGFGVYGQTDNKDIGAVQHGDLAARRFARLIGA